MRNQFYRIVCHLRRKFMWKEGLLNEAIYERCDNLKAAMDLGES